MADYILVNGIRVAKTFVTETFGRLTTVGPRFLCRRNEKHGRAFQVCQCVCGEYVVVVATNLYCGRGGNCSCINEIIKQKATTHGKTNSKLYAVHQTMIARCYNPNNSNYANYGGRGIGVCAQWQGPGGFLTFSVDLPPRPSDSHSIDRIDVNGNYEPGNVRWATKSEQALSRRNKHTLTHKGMTLNISEWAKKLGFVDSRIRSRLRAGWTIAQALDTPPGQKPTK